MPVLSQAQIISAWGPPCAKTKRVTIDLNGTGRVTVQAAIADATLALDAVFREHSYITRAAQTGAGVCRHKVGSAGWSIHALWIALDVNWLLNPQGTHRTDMTPAMRADIKRIRTNNGVQVWACGYDWHGLPDPMHIEICCAPRDIAHGIDESTVPDGWPGSPSARPPLILPATPIPPTPLMEDDDMRLVQLNEAPGIALLVSGGGITKLSGESLGFWEKHLPKIPINAREYDLIVADAGHGADPAFARHP